MLVPVTLDSKIVIVGAGIGGLSLALALAKKGATNIQIFERRSHLQELGAGLQLGPNATRLLAHLGVGEQLAAASERFPCGEMFEAQTGRKLTNLPLDEYAYRTYGAHNYQLLRTDLLDLLWQALKGVLGADPVQTGAELKSLTDTGQPSACFSGGREEPADLVIGADGVESRTRGLIFDDGEAEYSGYFAWRGLLDTEHLNPEYRIESLRVWMDAGRHLIAYPLKQGKLINLVGVSEQKYWSHDHPVEPSPVSAWLADCPGWDSSALNLVRSLPSCNKWSLRLIPALKSWGKGALGLMGDAAHPMVPSLAQGAGQALEDAVCLAQLVEQGRYSGEALLQNYYAIRSNRVKRVQQASLWNLRYFHRAQTFGSRLQNIGMRLGGPVTSNIIARRYHWLYRE